MSAPKPSDLELQLLLGVSKLTVAQIAERVGAPVSTVHTWVHEYKARTGQHRTQVRKKTRTAKTRAQLTAIAADMLDGAVEIARDEGGRLSADPKTRIQLAKLRLEIRSAILDTVNLAPDDKKTADRPDLLELVRKATAGAEARRPAVH